MNAKRPGKFARANALARYERHRRANLLARPGVHGLVIVLDHLKAGFNVAKIFRSAEAFGARGVHLIGIPPFDPAPAKGGFKAVPARWFDSFAESHRSLMSADYRIYRFSADAENDLADERFADRSAFVLGHEELGCSFAAHDYPGMTALRIPQFGHIQSLNVSVAAAIAMYEYVRQRRE
ncbi:MAG: hypothetical protein K9M02_00685 [Thiohalocapsa sp.]|nr:hypothetical protein [Thiohalocapsa sp.]